MSENKDTLEKYEPLLDAWMKDIPMHLYTPRPKGRSVTFRHVLHAMCRLPRRVRILELGTSRSFVDGRFPGCNSNDIKYWDPHDFSKWDFGAGCFTYLCAEFMTRHHPDFLMDTLDIQAEHMARSKHMTQPFASHMRYFVHDSVKFLSEIGTKYDLIYLDTGDVTPVEKTAKLQLEEARQIVRRNLLAPGGFILIDDVRHPTCLQQTDGHRLGKAKYSIPFLQKHGFEIVMDEYQVVMQKVVPVQA